MKGKPTTPIVIGQHSKGVTGLALVNESTLVSGSLDCSVNTWDLRQPGHPVRSTSIDSRWQFQDLAKPSATSPGSRPLCATSGRFYCVALGIAASGNSSDSSVLRIAADDAISKVDQLYSVEDFEAADANPFNSCAGR